MSTLRRATTAQIRGAEVMWKRGKIPCVANAEPSCQTSWAQAGSKVSSCCRSKMSNRMSHSLNSLHKQSQLALFHVFYVAPTQLVPNHMNHGEPSGMTPTWPVPDILCNPSAVASRIFDHGSHGVPACLKFQRVSPKEGTPCFMQNNKSCQQSCYTQACKSRHKRPSTF